MSTPPGIRLLRWVVILAAAAAALGGLTMSGPPREERSRQLDERRRGELESLASRIDGYWNARRMLPPTLDALVEPGDRFATPVPRDPKTAGAYEYAIVDSLNYRLCATFETDSQATARREARLAAPDASHFWDHPAGRHCYTIKVHRREPVAEPYRKYDPGPGPAGPD